MNTKQKRYLEILRIGIVAIRTFYTDHYLCHTLADLIHNIPGYIENLEDRNDKYFLEIEVKSYISYCAYLGIAPYQSILDEIDKLSKDLN